jgi:molybdenum cofactor cytidylyltransferase
MMQNLDSSAVILLGAGNSSRMGTAKQLLDFQGQPLLRYTAGVALASRCRPVIVVLGYGEPEMRAALSGLDVEIAINPRWAEGMGGSIQTGLNALKARSVNGAVLALADQPFVTSGFLNSLVEKHHESGKPIVSARYSGTVGVPVFFAREVFHHLLALEPDRGCKGVILANASEALLLDCPEAAIDIDTPEDYAHATLKIR